MKRKLAYLLAVLTLTMGLAGCGDSNMDNDMLISPSPSAAHTAMPSASPYISPDVDNGIVGDEDGIIDEGDTGADNYTNEESTISASPLAE